MKKARLKPLFAVWLALALAGCSPAPAELAKQTFVVELGSDVYGNPQIYLKNTGLDTTRMSVEPVNEQVVFQDNRFITPGLEYLAVGEYDFQVINGGQKIPFRIKIKDTRPPVLGKKPATLMAHFGQAIDWAEVYEATDLSGVSYDAPADVTASVGVKNITVRISDKFGNTEEAEIEVTVV